MIKVAQCWDDGVATDIRLIEILRKYNAKATFNLCPGRMPKKTTYPFWLEPMHRGWTFNGFSGGIVGQENLLDVYSGFQVASHCWEHEVAGIVPDDVFLQKAVDARSFLEDIFQRDCPGFAWPCGRYTPETVKMLADAGFRYGRTVENTNDVTANSEPLAMAANCHFLDPLFWGIFDRAKETGVFYFWGHSYEMMDFDTLWERFEAGSKALSEDPEVEWVDVIDLVPRCHSKGK